jgi:hypothetical protein
MKLILKLVLLAILMSACSGGEARRSAIDRDESLIDYQFIDADTMKPIKGAYASVAWVSQDGSQCLKAALLRSDVNGRVKMDGPKGSYQRIPTFMVPGYQHLGLTFQLEPTATVHKMSVYRQNYVQFPAWSKALRDMGYQVIDIPTNTSVEIRKNFNHIPVDRVGPGPSLGDKLYFVTLRALPGAGSNEMPNIHAPCGPGGENIGLSLSQQLATNTVRAVESTRILCDEKWDSATGRQPYGALTTALWLVGGPENFHAASREFARQLPNYPILEGPSSSRAFTKSERLAFCAWIQPYSEQP